MKHAVVSAAIGVMFAAGAAAQIQVDKPIQLTGSGANARVSGIQSISASQDATSAEAIQKNQVSFSSSTFASNVYSITLSPAPAAYTAGMAVHFQASAANAGAASVNVNGLGAVPIKKHYNVDLAANDIRSGQMVSVMYDGSAFQMVSQLGNASGGSQRYLGESYGGGVIFFLYKDAGGVERGLICATTDLGTSVGSSNAPPDFNSDWDGFANSNTISTNTGTYGSNSAAKVARQYTGGGFTDWYLPSTDEFRLLIANQWVVVQNPAASALRTSLSFFNTFWTSTSNNASGYGYFRADGAGGTAAAGYSLFSTNSYYVLPIRRF